MGDAVRDRLAYVPGDVNLWPNLSGGECIDLLTRMRGGADPRLRARLLADFELDPRDPDNPLLESLLVVVLGGVVAAVVKTLLSRKAAQYYRSSTGHLPADLQPKVDTD